MDTESSPAYLRIAQDLAHRIAQGEFGAQQKLSGRSTLSSEYGVSPETVRKAIHLLADMKVVEVKEKSGVVVLSADNARRYLDSFRKESELQTLHRRFRELYDQYTSVGQRMREVCEQMSNAQAHPLPLDRYLPSYEVQVGPDSGKIGQSIGSMQFWQSTGATVVAIRRKQNTILSPGPYAELYGGDTVVFVGPPESEGAVAHFLNG